MAQSELQISRTAIWKHIKKLEAAGYRIEASRRLGYGLTGRPSKLTAPELHQVPREKRNDIGGLRLLDEVDSTQNIAQRLAEEGAPKARWSSPSSRRAAAAAWAANGYRRPAKGSG